MHEIQRKTSEKRNAATLLKETTMQGEINKNDNRAGRPQSATLRRLLNKEITQKPPRQNIFSRKKEIELVKFRVLLLCQEKSRKIALLRHKTQSNKTLYDENDTKSKICSYFNYYISWVFFQYHITFLIIS